MSRLFRAWMRTVSLALTLRMGGLQGGSSHQRRPTRFEEEEEGKEQLTARSR